MKQDPDSEKRQIKKEIITIRPRQKKTSGSAVAKAIPPTHN